MTDINPTLLSEIESIDLSQIKENRKELLDQISKHIEDQMLSNNEATLVFVCTHNSRRSQFAQVWASIMAEYYGFLHINSLSAGTEATALFPQVAKTLEQAGISVRKEADKHINNPRYLVQYNQSGAYLELYSKTVNEIPEQKNGFIAIMVCSDAEENCPFIPAAKARIALQYTDPKMYDGSEKASEEYKKTSKQIAAEMAYLFSTINPVKE
jgi:protein-tyrosine-phosphatase